MGYLHKSTVIESLRKYANNDGERLAIATPCLSFSYRQLFISVNRLSDWLKSNNIERLALVADNSFEWVVVDLACLNTNVTLVPVPHFFTPEQQLHMLENASVEWVACVTGNDTDIIANKLPSSRKHATLPFLNLNFYSLAHSKQHKSLTIPSETAKITYTSGSTGKPKGVCLSYSAIETVSNSLAEAVEIEGPVFHFCSLPLTTLLENIAGVYVPLLKGGAVVLIPFDQLGISGSSGLDLNVWGTQLNQWQPESIILTPELLKAFIHLVEKKHVFLGCLKFVAVGGGKVSEQLLVKANALGLPVFEGYGLSECCSVVALNRPSVSKPGSVGKPLDHVSISIADDGEIMVSGTKYLGYLGEPVSTQETIATGDLGSIDDDGFLIVDGRKKNLLISSFGRNISPEWVEAKLCASPHIVQAMLAGDGKPFNVAIITPLLKTTPDCAIDDLIAQINQSLPDYAQVKRWIRTHQPFTSANNQLTENGRIKRTSILHTYQMELSAIYSNKPMIGQQEIINEIL